MRGGICSVNSENSPGLSHVSCRTKSITNREQARHIKCRIQPQGERPQALPRHHTQSEERNLGSCPEFASNPEERTPSLIPGEHPNLREKLQDQVFPRSSQHGSMRIHDFTGSSSAPGCPAFQTTPLFQWRQLQMAADIPACQYQQSSAVNLDPNATVFIGLYSLWILMPL